MPRPEKIGLDYFPFDVDFFDDEKIGAISGEFGLKGEMTAIRLLCAVYRNGYFAVWGDTLKMKLQKSLPGVSEDLLEQIVNRLVRWGFFDKDLFGSVRVLTSKGIQRRFFSATKRRKNIKVETEYLLVSPEEYGVTVSQERKPYEKQVSGVIASKNGINVDIMHTETPLLHTISTQKKSKGKESKEYFSSSAQAQEENPKEKKKEFFEIFFFRNFTDPHREVERFIAWNAKKGTNPTRYDAELWNPENKDGKRFNDRFLTAWKNLYALAKYSGPNGERASEAMLDHRVSLRALNGKWVLTCPDIVAAWMNANPDPVTQYLKPLLKNFPLEFRTYKIE